MLSRQSLLKNILFSAILVLLFFTVLEVLVRVLFDFEVPREKAEIEYEVDSDLLWYYRPDQCVVQAPEEIEYRINSRGLRCADFPTKKPEGEIRLLIIGDSVTFGWGVREDQAYPQMLQKYLDSRYPDVLFRVINGGVNAYSTREELMFLRKRGIAFEPDIVIVGFVLNDVSLESRRHYLEKFRKLKSSEPEKVLLRSFSALLRRSHFAMSLMRVPKIVKMRAGGRKESFETQRTLHYKDLLSIEKKEVEEGWDLALGELDEMMRFLDESGIKMVVVGFPARQQLDEIPTPDKPQVRLREFCLERNLLFVDLLPDFLENKNSHLFLDRIHPTPTGYDLAAEMIGQSLRVQES